MQYMIFDSAGNALASFDDEGRAHATLYSILRIEPDAAEHVALLAYDDDGMPVGDALTVFDVPPPVSVEPSQFLQAPRLTAPVGWQFSRTQNRFFGEFVTRDRVRTV